jgi:alpha-beta hydrolase superfamily lysophospholipase
MTATPAKTRPEPGRAATALLCGLLLILLAACAPQLAPPGPGLAALEVSAPTLRDATFVTSDGTELPLRHWQPPAGIAPHGVVLALHGFNDYSNAFADSGPALAKAGLVVYAYDQRGFGEAPHRGLWPGVEALTGDLATAAELVTARHPGLPLYLLGESMGGAVVLAALAGSESPQAAGVILAAPAVWARSTMPFHQRAALWLGARLFPWARFSGRGLGIQASDNIEMLRALGRDPLFIKETRTDTIDGLVNLMDAALQAGPRIDERALLLYGQRDQVIPAEPTIAFWRSLPEAAAARQRFAYYPEGWHMLLRDLQAEVVIADIAAWIRAPQAPLPSGAEAHAAAALARNAAGNDSAEADPETAAATCEAAAC